MLIRSQPLADEVSKKLELSNEEEIAGMSDRNIQYQYIGNMFDDILSDDKKHKISLKTRIHWRLKRVKGWFYDIKYNIRSHIKWCKTIRKLRPWEGFDGLLSVMLMHLMDYVAAEERYGHSTEEYKNQKIASVQKTIEILERMKEPNDYWHKRCEAVEAKYPQYQSLIPWGLIPRPLGRFLAFDLALIPRPLGRA